MENVTEEKHAGPSPSADEHASGVDDLISCLNNDVLLHILGLVGDARDVVRTGALSTRWRDLWTGVAALNFDAGSRFVTLWNARRFIAFVDNVLNLRARSESYSAMERLEISLGVYYGRRDRDRDPPHHLPPPCAGAAVRWIRYAVRHVSTSFVFQVRVALKDWMGEDEGEDVEHVWVKSISSRLSILDYPVIGLDLDDLPGSAKLQTMRLFLGGARVRLPKAAVFASLTELALESMEIAAAAGGGQHLLAGLLSPASCPRLRKLRLWAVQLPVETQLLLESDVLTELTLEDMDKLKSLELRTPNLLGLSVKDFGDLVALTVSAPKLKEIACAYNTSLVAIHGDDLPCVSTLKVDLWTHDDDGSDINDVSFGLLQRCSSAISLVVFLHIDIPLAGEDWVDLIKDRMPRPPHVTSLEIHVHHISERHCTADCTSNFLAQFSSLRYFALQLDEVDGCTKKDSMCPGSGGDLYYACDHLDGWSPHKISLVHLKEAEFRGLTGTDCELRFLQRVLVSVTNLQKVVVRFSVNYRLENRRNDFIHMMLDDGTWTAYHDAYDQPYEYQWRPSTT